MEDYSLRFFHNRMTKKSGRASLRFCATIDGVRFYGITGTNISPMWGDNHFREVFNPDGSLNTSYKGELGSLEFYLQGVLHHWAYCIASAVRKHRIKPFANSREFEAEVWRVHDYIIHEKFIKAGDNYIDGGTFEPLEGLFCHKLFGVINVFE